MYIVFTKPNKFTKTYTEACQIAEEYYNNTGEIVAVEKSEHHGDYRTNYYLNGALNLLEKYNNDYDTYDYMLSNSP